jgi:molybdopterin molybdotransferase
MMTENEARARILAEVEQLPARTVALGEAQDRFAAEDLFARVPLPAFDNSAMDGYAVVARSSGAGKHLRVIGEQPAGIDRALRVAEGEAVRIFTGAPIPAGADAIVMQEETTRDGDYVTLKTAAEPGEFIRRRGCDLAEGQRILERGQKIRPALAGLLASQGVAEISVGGVVKAAVLSTGDETIKAGKELQPGQIYESNSVLLAGLLRKTGAEVARIGHARDERKELSMALQNAVNEDVLIISGGVSVGEHDLVQAAIREAGGRIDIWRVAIKPGKPFLFGQIGKCKVFGLPGNPVSAFVTYLRLVRPAILKMMGASAAEQELPRVRACLTSDLTNEDDRVYYIRGRYADGAFNAVGRQESHALFGLSRGNALARVAPGEHLPAGAMLDIELWD